MFVGRTGSKVMGVVASAALTGFGLLAGSAAAAAPSATPVAQTWQVTVGAQPPTSSATSVASAARLIMASGYRRFRAA